jgi:hypothetical protein
MLGWRAATESGPIAATTGRPVGRRFLTHYLTDLTTTVVLVLAVGWIIQASASDHYLRDAMVTQNDIYISISRFTPHNLATNYVNTVETMSRNLPVSYEYGRGYADIMHDALIKVATLILNVVVAVPETVTDLYRQTSGTAAWIVLAGFAVALGSVFAALVGTRTSLWRLFLATVVSPPAISVLFVAMQGFMVVMLDTFYWFTLLAPLTVACPVLCTLYWIAFPNAERGITVSAAHAVLNFLEPKTPRFNRR